MLFNQLKRRLQGTNSNSPSKYFRDLYSIQCSKPHPRSHLTGYLFWRTITLRTHPISSNASTSTSSNTCLKNPTNLEKRMSKSKIDVLSTPLSVQSVWAFLSAQSSAANVNRYSISNVSSSGSPRAAPNAVSVKVLLSQKSKIAI